MEKNNFEMELEILRAEVRRMALLLSREQAREILADILDKEAEKSA